MPKFTLPCVAPNSTEALSEQVLGRAAQMPHRKPKDLSFQVASPPPIGLLVVGFEALVDVFAVALGFRGAPGPSSLGMFGYEGGFPRPE